MKTLGSILKVVGGFSLVMTGLHLWRVGFPRLEGPESESGKKVLSIVASYAIIGLISFVILGLGNYLCSRPAQNSTEPQKEPKETAQQWHATDGTSRRS